MSQVDLEKRIIVSQLKAPLTLPLVRDQETIFCGDRLLMFLHNHLFSYKLLFLTTAILAGGAIALLADFTFLYAGPYNPSMSLDVSLPWIGGLSLYLLAGSYYLALASGQAEQGGTLSQRLVIRRILRKHKRELQKGIRQAKLLDESTGWRPRHGIPHPAGRSDYHDRWLIEAHHTELGVVLGLRHWTYTSTDYWQPQDLNEVIWVKDDAEVAEHIGEHRAHLEKQIRMLESEAQKRFQEELAALQRKPDDHALSAAALVQHVNEQSAAVI